MDDLQMSAHLAKLSTIHSYELEFRDTIDDILKVSEAKVLIIDLNSIPKKDLIKLYELKHDQSFTCVGYCEKLNSTLINYFKGMGCDMVFKRHELMKNLGSILIKLFNASCIP